MKPTDAKEIIACMPQGRTLFHYFKDRYALTLLRLHVGEAGKTVREIKQSPFAKLLDRPMVKELVAREGHRPITELTLRDCWPPEVEPYLLTLGTWADDNTRRDRDYFQTTQVGSNLVLQLNFSNKHNAPYQSLIKPEEHHPFSYAGHPVAREGYLTLAWARIDLDLERGEALIEEIQNDWLRSANRGYRTVEHHLEHGGRDDLAAILERRGVHGKPHELKQYVTDVLKPHFTLWQEAMLTATLWFLCREIGIRTIFYHAWESGNQLKGIDGTRLPPRSLYTELPKKFCFQPTAMAPYFLLESEDKEVRERVRGETVKFQVLAF